MRILNNDVSKTVEVLLTNKINSFTQAVCTFAMYYKPLSQYFVGQEILYNIHSNYVLANSSHYTTPAVKTISSIMKSIVVPHSKTHNPSHYPIRTMAKCSRQCAPLFTPIIQLNGDQL